MKKLLTVLFAGLFLFAAVPAMADHPVWTGEPNYKFAVGGQIEIDGWLQDNYYNANQGKASVLNDDQTRYYNEETRIWFKGNWGDVEGLVRLEWDYDWDQTSQNKGNTAQNAMDLAFLKFPVPGTPVKIQAGLSPVAFGKSIFLDDSFYTLMATAAVQNMSFSLATLKVTETYTVDDDKDIYFGLLNTKAIPNNDLTLLALTIRDGANDDFKPWDIGAYLNGSAAMMKYFVEGHYQFGTVAEDVDLAAFGLLAGATFTAGPADITIMGAYGSGDDDATDDEVNEFYAPYAYSLPDLIVVDDLNGKTIKNVWAIMAKAGLKPAANLAAFAQIGFYNRVEEVVPDETYIGTEIDLGATLTINDFMKWKVTFGYLSVGDGLALDQDDLMEVNNEFLVTF